MLVMTKLHVDYPRATAYQESIPDSIHFTFNNVLVPIPPDLQGQAHNLHLKDYMKSATTRPSDN